MCGLKRKEEHWFNLLPSWQAQAQDWHVQGEGLRRQSLSQGSISMTSLPAGWESPYSGFLDDYFVYSQTMSTGGKGSSFSSFPSVHGTSNADKQAGKKPSYANSFRMLNSVLGAPLALEGRKAHIPDSTPATHFLSWVCTHSEMGAYNTGPTPKHTSRILQLWPGQHLLATLPITVCH